MEKDQKQYCGAEEVARENLKPVAPFAPRWVKGQSGNPAGRPQRIGLTIVEAMNFFQSKTTEELELIQNNPRESVVRRMAAARLLGAGERGRDGREEFSEVMDRSVGRPSQALELSGPGGGPIVSQVQASMTLVDATQVYQAHLAALRAGQVVQIEAPATDVEPIKADDAAKPMDSTSNEDYGI